MSSRLTERVRERFAAVLAWGRRTCETPSRRVFIRVLARVGSDSQELPAAALALDALEARIPELVTRATAGLAAFVDVLVTDEDTRAEMLEDARTATAAWSGDAFLDALHAASIEWGANMPAWPTLDLEALGPGQHPLPALVIRAGETWPPDVAPDDALAWLEGRTRAEEQGLRAAVAKFRKGLAAGLNPGHPALRLVMKDGDREHVLTFGGAAVLYAVERTAGVAPRLMRPPRDVLSDVSPVSVAAYQALAGVDLCEHGPRSVRNAEPEAHKVTYADSTTGVLIHWRDGRRRSTEIQLRLPGAELTVWDAVLRETRAAYGDAAVRGLFAAAVFSFFQNRKAGDSVMLYADEVCRLSGVDDDTRQRRRFAEAFRDLNGARIVTKYGSGKELDEPLVAEVGIHRDGRGRVVAYEVRLARVLFRGVRDETGEPGNYFIAAPIELIAAGPRVAMLAPVLGPSFRGTIGERGGPFAKFGRRELADRIGIPSRSAGKAADRETDSRQLETLDETLEAGRGAGFIGSVERHGPGPDGVLIIRPGARPAAVLKGGAIRRAAPLPERGADVARWLDARARRDGLTIAQAAEELGVHPRTLTRSAAEPTAALSAELRAAFRRRLWGPAWA